MRLVTIEGTPADVRRFEELAKSTHERQTCVEEPLAIREPSYSDLIRFIRNTAKPTASRLIVKFAERALTIPFRGGYLGHLIAVSPNSQPPSPCFTISTAAGREYVAVAFVRPASALITFRLPRGDADGSHFARSIRSGNVPGHEVQIRLVSDDSVSEALTLLERAVLHVRELRRGSTRLL
jgi:hypothetical protein